MGQDGESEGSKGKASTQSQRKKAGLVHIIPPVSYRVKYTQ